MKDMIQQIVEADRKAQALVQQAEKEKTGDCLRRHECST